MKGKRTSKLGLIVVLIAVLAMILVVALSSTASASGQYNFDPGKYNLKDFDGRIDWSQVGWCNFDFSKVDLSNFDWESFDWEHFKWGHECTTTVEETTTVSEEVTTTVVSDITSNPNSTAGEIQTGGGGTAGPGAGTWALGFFALALAGGLGFTAIRPALKRK